MKYLKKLLALLVALCLLTAAALGEGLTAEDDLMAEAPVPEAGETELWTEDMQGAGEPAVAAAESVAIDAAHFPDAVFREKVKEKCDRDGDGVLSPEEIEEVTELIVCDFGIADVTGVEYFWNLRNLDVTQNQLTRLDVSGNPKLEQLSTGLNNLTELDVTCCPELAFLSCGMQSLKRLDAHGLARLAYIYADATTYDPDAKTSLADMNVRNCASLTSLYCRGAALTGLDLTGCDALEYLDCSGSDIAGITGLGSKKRLEMLHCEGCKLTSLDVSGCAGLLQLFAGDNQLTGLDLTGCDALVRLDCQGNRLTRLDVSGKAALAELNCGGNDMSELILGAHPGLKTLTCQRNRLTKLDVTGCTALEQLYCGVNRLTALDVSQCPLLLLSCPENQLTSLDARRVSRTLNCANNQLTELRMSGGPQFDILYCNGNRLTKLDLSGLGGLMALYCQDNALTELDISGCLTLGCAFDPVYSYKRSLESDGTTAVFTDPVSYTPSLRSSMGIALPNDVLKIDASIRVTENGKVVYDGDLTAKPTADTGNAGAKAPKSIYLSRYGNMLGNGSQTNVFFGWPAQLDVVMTPADAQTTLIWVSEDPSVATVEDGLVTAVSKGRTTVSVRTSNGLAYSVLVNVLDPGSQATASPAPAATAAPQATLAPQATPAPQATTVPQATAAPTAVPVNGTVTVASGTYRLAKDGTVTFVKPAKSAKTAKVPATVKVNGKSARVTAIADKAFYKDRKLTAVTVGKYVKTIGKNAFYGCAKLKTVKGGAAVTTIKEGAFQGCKALTAITLNSKVTTLGKKAFYGCAKLKTVTIKTAKLTAKTVGASAFKGINAAVTFKCPKKQLKAYKALLKKKGAPKKAKYK